jgi:glucosyl-3-phosphoglycerate synthase
LDSTSAGYPALMDEWIDASARDWFHRRSFASPPLTRDEMAAVKAERGIRVSVCLPTLDEAATVGDICEVIGRELVEDRGLVDELVVVDSGSEDSTTDVAARAGASVHSVGEVLPEWGPGPGRGGKGEALWKSLAVCSGDLVVWVDADIRNFSIEFVTNLIAPLLAHPELAISKGFYERPLMKDDETVESGGARVTELAARPLIQLLYPELGGVIQPLSGEYAGYRDKLLQLPFFSGYAVDVVLLLDVAERFGIDAMAQIDLGTRIHRNRDLLSLGRTSFAVVKGVLSRLDALGRIKVPDDMPDRLLQFASTDGEMTATGSLLPVVEFPPLASVLGDSAGG